MRSDDDKTQDSFETPTDAAASGEPTGEPTGGATQSPTPPPSPWQPPSPGGPIPAANSQWGVPSSGPVAWQAQQPPAQQPPAPPIWPGASGWQASQPPQGFGYGSMPPAGDVRSRRPSRLPQVLVIIAACMITFSGGLIVDHVGFPAATPVTLPGSTATPFDTGTISPTQTAAGTSSGNSLYDEAVRIVKQYFVGRKSVTDQQLLYGSIKGMIESLGDTGHSTFLTPEEYAAWQASLNASVAGIGVMLSNADGIFLVDRVIPGSPAEAAGVKAGDQITAVDGVNTAGMSFSDLSSKIRGDAGTKVTITVIHRGSTTAVDITITRANIVVPLADWGMVPGTHVADIVLTEFGSGAADQLQADITAAQKAGATSMILDLRGNPGGYASEARDVASEFLSSGVVYIEQDANGTNTEIRVNTARQHTNMPLVVVVDHNSASASEIVAGALQDAGRAKIVGVNTFGTGTVLQQFPLSDGSVIILGTAWWLTPKGHRIFGVGIKPDEIVQMPAGILPIYPTDLPTMSSADLNASGDTQLLAAVKDLNK